MRRLTTSCRVDEVSRFANAKVVIEVGSDLTSSVVASEKSETWRRFEAARYFRNTESLASLEANPSWANPSSVERLSSPLAGTRIPPSASSDAVPSSKRMSRVRKVVGELDRVCRRNSSARMLWMSRC